MTRILCLYGEFQIATDAQIEVRAERRTGVANWIYQRIIPPSNLYLFIVTSTGQNGFVTSRACWKIYENFRPARLPPVPNLHPDRAGAYDAVR